MRISSSFFFLSIFLLFLPGRSNAQQWIPVSEIPAAEITALFAQGDTLFAAGPNKIYVTFDGAQTWDSTAALDLSFDFIKALYYVNHQLFVGTGADGMFRSDDGGQSWQADNTGLSGAGALDISSLAVRGDSLYVGTYGAGVFVKKISANSSWSGYKQDLPWGNIGSLTNIDGTLFAGSGGNATVSKQVYPGHTWTEIPFALFNGSLNFFLGVVRQDTVLLAAGTQGLYRSTDNGDTWTHYDPGTGILGSATLVVTGERVIANLAKPVGLTFILYSDDHGLTWQTFQPEITGSYGHDIAVLNGRLYSARSNGLWVADLSTSVQEPAVAEISLGQNFPNPFSQETIIPIVLTRSSWLELAVFDRQGKPVGIIWRGEKPEGKYAFPFQTNTLPAGVYYYRLTTAGGVLSRPMMIVK